MSGSQEVISVTSMQLCHDVKSRLRPQLLLPVFWLKAKTCDLEDTKPTGEEGHNKGPGPTSLNSLSGSGSSHCQALAQQSSPQSFTSTGDPSDSGPQGPVSTLTCSPSLILSFLCRNRPSLEETPCLMWFLYYSFTGWSPQTF